MADNLNKFKVYGQIPAEDNIYPNDDEKYDALYGEGIKPDTLAKAQDVLTPFRELTVFSVSFFNWLQTQVGEGVTEFKNPEVDDSDPTATQTNLDNMIANIVEALNQAISNKIGSKESELPRPSTNGTYFLKGVKSSGGFRWDITDNATYQLASTILTDLVSKYTASANQGFQYKSANFSTVKLANKNFIYFDSEEPDTSGNYILNLKSFNFNE